jgi:hypothetical protein
MECDYTHLNHNGHQGLDNKRGLLYFFLCINFILSLVFSPSHFLLKFFFKKINVYVLFFKFFLVCLLTQISLGTLPFMFTHYSCIYLCIVFIGLSTSIYNSCVFMIFFPYSHKVFTNAFFHFCTIVETLCNPHVLILSWLVLLFTQFFYK